MTVLLIVAARYDDRIWILESGHKAWSPETSIEAAYFTPSICSEYETTDNARLDLAGRIARVDREIDGLVYELYGLTEEEIKIVEGK